MREIILDVETTGLDWKKDRIIEIGCVEIFDKIPTGDIFHIYLHPEQILSEENMKIHGITNEFLQDKGPFSHIANNLLDFLGNTPIVAHNAVFDMGFLNAELERMFFSPLTNKVIDTLLMARKIFTTNNSLDGLCKKYKINIDHRQYHGALKDAELLAKVYYYLSCENHNSWATILEQPSLQENTEIFFTNRPSVILTELEHHQHNHIMSMLKPRNK